MSIIDVSAKIMNGFSKVMNFLSPIFDLGVRLWVAYVFFKSGLTKIQSWDTTKMLFEYEYEVPLLPPEMAAYLGTAAELGLPVLLALGLVSRFTALALFLFNIVAVVSYSSFLLGEHGAAGLQQHILWGLMMLVTLFHGPGKLSIDYLLCKKCA